MTFYDFICSGSFVLFWQILLKVSAISPSAMLECLTLRKQAKRKSPLQNRTAHIFTTNKVRCKEKATRNAPYFDGNCLHARITKEERSQRLHNIQEPNGTEGTRDARLRMSAGEAKLVPPNFSHQVSFLTTSVFSGTIFFFGTTLFFGTTVFFRHDQDRSPLSNIIVVAWSTRPS